MYTLPDNRLVYAMSPTNEPAIRVRSGDEILVHTCDCFENQIQSADQDFGSIDWDHINPATGPIYVEGAEPGDLLVVHIKDIKLADRGVMTTGPHLGVLGDELERNVVKMVPIQNGQALFSDDLSFPVAPMIGVIGTAPAQGSVPCGTPGTHGGNMDCKRITTGSYLILPVNVSGALLALGDLHAAMADGEVAVCGIEIAGSVELSVHVLKDKKWPAPMLLDPEFLMTIASHEDLDIACEQAVKNMVHLLESECGMEKAEATFLLSAVGDLRVCQMVDPLRTARVELPRSIAEKKGFELKL